MKRLFSIVAVAALCVTFSGMAQAEEVKSGLQPGDFIGAFNVTKITGAEDDGVAVGKNLCYRCKNGGRPQIMVFTRSTDDKVVALVKKLDAELAKEKDLRVFVNVLGDSQDTATEAAKKFAEATGAKMVPFVVPNEVENGPEDYGINAKADVTVILATGGKVKANHAAASAKDLDADAVLASVPKILEKE